MKTRVEWVVYLSERRNCAVENILLEGVTAREERTAKLVQAEI